jgi:hypothetical protein
MADRARRLDPPLLTEGPVSDKVFVVTVGRQLENGVVVSTTKYDVTDQFKAMARRRGWVRIAEHEAEERRANICENALRIIRGPWDASGDDEWSRAYRDAGGGYEGLQAIADAALKMVSHD